VKLEVAAARLAPLQETVRVLTLEREHASTGEKALKVCDSCVRV